jgi:carboxyl-terminal processing protease
MKSVEDEVMRMNTWRRPLVIGALMLASTLACNFPLLNRATPSPTSAPTPSATERHLKVFEEVWEAVRMQYVRQDYDGVDWEAVGQEYRARVEAGLDEATFTQTVRDMLAELPEGQAAFQTRAERLEEETTDISQYQGIGAFISFRHTPEPHIVILSVIRDSPAEASGLQPHDSIYAVDGEPIRAEDAENPAARIRGPAETAVTLSVQTPGEARREVTLPRAQITAADILRGGVLPTLNVAYFRVPVAVNQDIATLMAGVLAQAAETEAVQGVILDLRVAGSGAQGWPLDGMLALFGNGDLGEYYDRVQVETLTIEGQDIGGSQTVPLVILVGPDTRGSPEIFAGALQGMGRARLVGLPTPGAVDGFTEISLIDGSRLFLATSSFRTMDGTDLSAAGLQPDVRVEVDWDAVLEDQDPAVTAALELMFTR